MTHPNSVTDCIHGDAQIENAANAMQKTHIEICKKLVELEKKEGVPMRLLIYIAIGTNAHKRAVYNAMYKKIDIDKANDVIKMAKMISEVYGAKCKVSEPIYHTLSRFYDLGGDSTQLAEILKRNKIEFMSVLYTAKDIAKHLFSDSEFTEKGYLKKIK